MVGMGLFLRMGRTRIVRAGIYVSSSKRGGVAALQEADPLIATMINWRSHNYAETTSPDPAIRQVANRRLAVPVSIIPFLH